MVAVKEIAKFDGADVCGMKDEDFAKKHPGVPRMTGPGRIVCCAMPSSDELITVDCDSTKSYPVPPWVTMIHGVSSLDGKSYAAFLSKNHCLPKRDEHENRWSHPFVVRLDGVQFHDSRADEPKKFRFQSVQSE